MQALKNCGNRTVELYAMKILFVLHLAAKGDVIEMNKGLSPSFFLLCTT